MIDPSQSWGEDVVFCYLRYCFAYGHPMGDTPPRIRDFESRIHSIQIKRDTKQEATTIQR